MPAEPLPDYSSSVSLTNIELIDLFKQSHSSLHSQPFHGRYPNDRAFKLIHHGYIGCAPLLYPCTAAISLCTLAAYRQMHRSCPRFSIQVQVKSLCFLHNTPYQPYLNIQFSAAFDIYLEILHRVKQCLLAALNHDTLDWRMLNSCLACFYKLEDELVLQFDQLVSINSNNSLKCWDSSIYSSNQHIDSCKAWSDYWLDPCDVDQFKDESDHTMQRDTNDNNWEDEMITAEGTTPALNCVNQWHNAGLDTCKKMFAAVFDQSGIFIAVCHHRFVVLACNMIWNGELVKYPLARIEKLLAIYGENSGCAYDIGCTFSKTLTNSSLGMRARELDLHLMVGVFHGHAHNCKCQLDWHPMYIPGTGHTEGEGCKHVFSSLNELACSTRHTSPFHWTIKEHFSFWDADKYTTLSE
ncbi:uncharacterized protein F5891DRAFT_953753 [Suillus fuscotomentosus]|uniref:Uncharacterized protein n=1 Tax=Suillus fuscotomentosus TaxID=1912939 RepID=A0AAD4HL62_9AGAM|nr:uncharacterized protein F5891DRAFT_953753 [Suillus fuscotomentosus]KAG1899504.1 hypothetical protein F5891DRAFT_953753 [Suillus fuscotomentosus]